MTIAQLPDGRQLQFPDNTSPEVIQRVVRQQLGIAEQPITQQPQESLGRTVLEQGLQGATFGFAEEITDPLGATLSTLVSEPSALLTGEVKDPSLSAEIAGVEAGTRERLAGQAEQRPGVSIASQLGGGLLTGGAAAGTKAGAALAGSLRTGGVTARAAKAAVPAAASGAAFGAGTAEEGERLTGAGQGAALGAVTGAALPVAGAALKRFRKSPIPNADQIRQQASQLYQTANEKGGVLTAKFTNNFVDKVEAFKPQTEIGKIIAGDSPVTKIIDRITTIRNKPITLEAAQELDELLGDAIDGFTDAGRLTKDGKKLLDIQTAFRESIGNASDASIIGGKEGFTALKEARKLWSTSRKLEDIERIIARAELTDNPATAIKSGFRALATNPKRLKGFSKQERKAIKAAAKGSPVTNVLRVFGSRLIPIVTLGAGGGLGATAATTAAATASRGLAARAQVGRAQRAAQTVAGETIPTPPAISRNKGLAAALIGGQAVIQ